MKTSSPPKTEIFLLLALKQSARQNPARQIAEIPLVDDIEELDLNAPGENLTEENFPVLFEQLSKKEAGKLRRLLASYQNKAEAERAVWRERIESAIGADEEFIDESVHLSHVEDALQKEIPAIRKILTAPPPNFNESRTFATPNKHLLAKNIRRAFARQFVAMRELTKATAFDRLNGTQLARLIRRAGIKEIAIACLRIEAVESVAAFLRQFSTEDARTIAAELGNPPQISDERIAFAENLVHLALETEPNRAAMLDWLGVWLIGILLCQGSSVRMAYTKQKLPLEFAPQLPEIIEEKCRQTPVNLQTEIGGEIEQLAREIFEMTDAV